MTYFTPSIEDIRIGYECECLWQRPEPRTWDKIEITETDTEEYLKLSVEDVIRRVKSNEIRVPYLTKEQIENCGFTLKHKSIDHWFQINEDKRFDTDLQNFCGYKAYNVFLNYGFHDYRLKIKGDFSGGEDFDKAETLYDGECKCINELKQILKQIHITPFYES
jgi:hypothetical protein